MPSRHVSIQTPAPKFRKSWWKRLFSRPTPDPKDPEGGNYVA